MTLAQLHAEYEIKFPGFINRSQVAEATRVAKLSGFRFSAYDAQRVVDKNI